MEQQKTLDPSGWVDRYGDRLYRYALSRLRETASAEDVVQETFVAALKARGQYTGRGSEAAWLMGILKRKIVDLIRQQARLRTGGEDLQHDPAQALFDERGNWQAEMRRDFGWQPSAALEKREFWQALRRCLEELPARQAGAFTLREIEALDSQTICKELEISPSHLWVLLYRARLQLSRCLKSKGYQDQGES